ncbi:hypothetical protein DM01DRAFT_1126118 [Hesseltinella vesiculosa]|uniref:Uncharacterized protein n=1 Tax=Hesseltinella vesiculosa TaxID=101127 RepID=A0A1X2GUC1_9FUNG|nr:hypothetical protein DM01DRAFT_1126118 [Hesseltinella vesiculosa]
MAIDEADARTQARRMSTLRQLERGTSVHKRSRSLGAMDKIYTADVALENGLVMTDAATSPVADQGGEDMSQWHRTIMDALQDPDEAAAVTTASGNDQLNNDVHVEPSPSSSASRPGSRARRNTLGQTDMLYYTQQQQLQVLQQQQMAQIQQYQQVAWQQQQQWMAAQAVQQQAALMQAYQVQQQQQQQQYRHQAPQPSSSRSANRLSAMDLLNQFEQEKAAKLPARRNKHKIDPSKAHIEGLLGNVKDQGQYTISFQQQQQAVKDRADRKYARPYTSNANYSSMPQRSTTPNNNNRRSMASSMMLGPGRTMVRSESSPNQLNPTLQHHPQQHSQSMYLDPTMAASSSASNLNLHRLTASKSTGRPVSSMMMRPHSSVDL